MTSLAVIIVSWNVRELLRSCLIALHADLAQAGVDARVIVVDSASSDGTPAMLRADFPEVGLIACPDNVGYVKGNNLALRAILDGTRAHAIENLNVNIGSSDYAWLLNPDTVVHPGATRALFEFMHANPRCGLCGPKLLNPDGSLQHGAFALPGLTQLALETQRLLWRFRNTRLDGRYAPDRFDGPPFRIGHPLGAAMLTRTAAIAQIGLLDEGFEMYSEEVDWAARMHESDWQVWCVPQAIVTHYGGASSGQASARAERVKWASRQRYYAKHYPPLKRWLAERMVPAQYRTQG